MNIQAISSAVSVRGCQPIKPVNFEGRRDKAPSFAKEVLDNDLIIYPPSGPCDCVKDTFCAPVSAEDKFDMACLVAGYYKTQYENLLEKGGCVV